MFDNALITLIIETLMAGEAAAGTPGLPIAQAFQPQQQGVDSEPTAYIYKLGDRRYGSPRKSDEWNGTIIVHTESQKYETQFQLSVLATQNPATPTQYTASDILNLCAYILQSDAAIAMLQAQGVGMERIIDVRNPPFDDDRGQFEFNPSFDFIVTHNQVITTSTPAIEEITFNMYEI